jgi:hypothetical protein
MVVVTVLLTPRTQIGDERDVFGNGRHVSDQRFPSLPSRRTSSSRSPALARPGAETGAPFPIELCGRHAARLLLTPDLRSTGFAWGHDPSS